MIHLGNDHLGAPAEHCLLKGVWFSISKVASFIFPDTQGDIDLSCKLNSAARATIAPSRDRPPMPAAQPSAAQQGLNEKPNCAMVIQCIAQSAKKCIPRCDKGLSGIKNRMGVQIGYPKIEVL